MFREDYIVRMIAQAATAITYLLGLTARERYPEALAEVENDPRALGHEIVKLLTYVGFARAVELDDVQTLTPAGGEAVIFDLVYLAQGRAGEAAERHSKALELYLEVAASGEQNRLAVAERLAALAGKLPPEAVAPDVQDWWDFIASGAPLATPDGPDGADPAA